MRQKENKISMSSNLLLFFLFVLTCLNQHSFAAELNDLYKPLLKKDQVLYEGKVSYFKSNEGGGYIGSYDSFDAQPHLYSFENNLTFAPADGMNISLGFNEIPPSSYTRDSFNSSGVLAAMQKFDLDYMQDYKVGLRFRCEDGEAYFNVLKKIQKAHWDWQVPPAPKFYFTDIYTDFQNYSLGLRHVAKPQTDWWKTSLSRITRSLLNDKQINVEAQLEYTTAKAKRNSDYQTINRFYNYYHHLEDKFSPGINVQYGLSDDWEFASGIVYTMPFTYEYEDRVYYADGTSRFRIGEYKLDNNVFIPLSSRFRLESNFEIALSCDLSYIEQRLAHRQKETDNSVTINPERELTYFNAKPEIKLTYLTNEDKKVKDDEFSSLSKELLAKEQLLLEFLYQKDITCLSRSASNGAHNIIDPYNVFLYPLDYFMVTTEYATFFTGNSSNFATNIMPQNYHLFKLSLRYGLTDYLDMGMGIGYHSSSEVDHSTLHDFKKRSYKFKPYYSFDWFFDWRFSNNTLFSFDSHYVPEYKTSIDIEGYTREYESENRYFECTAALKILF
ncbi:MAG: hypothetical protein KAJ14_16370 [Candidatus Omnitrophica bacterium]|nr:hypothetical protein [Candidatus Omnitrophota bacterium]